MVPGGVPPRPDRPSGTGSSSEDGRGPHGDEPPNNWQAIFGGPAWTRVAEPEVAGQWYLAPVHRRSARPELDNPDVVDYFDRVLRFWFDRGVDGFRVDSVAVLGKAPGLPDESPDGTGRRRSPGGRKAMPRGAAGAGWSTSTRPIIRTAVWCSSPRRTRHAGPTSCASSSTGTSSTRRSPSTCCSRPWSAAAYRNVVRSTVDAAACRRARSRRGR